MVVLHLGGRDSLSHLSGIHGVHLGHIEYIATDAARATTPWVQRRNPDGTETVFATAAGRGALPKGEHRVMDCIDCHNRAAHSLLTAEDALDRAMAEGAVSAALPFVHKEGIQLLKANFDTGEEARAQIPQQLAAFYRDKYPEVSRLKPDMVKAAGDELALLYDQNVFPEMKVTWGTHPNNIGHMSYPGCFRCHDGDHTSKSGATITQDCAACHKLVAVDEAKPKILADLEQ